MLCCRHYVSVLRCCKLTIHIFGSGLYQLFILPCIVMQTVHSTTSRHHLDLRPLSHNINTGTLFLQRWSSVADVGPALRKQYVIVFQRVGVIHLENAIYVKKIVTKNINDRTMRQCVLLMHA